MRDLESLRSLLPVGRLPVRYRLLAIALLPMLIILPLLLGIAAYRWNAAVERMLASKVHNDLTIAHQYLKYIFDISQDQLRSIGDSTRLQTLLRGERPSPEHLAAFLLEGAQARHFDFLYIIDDGGQIVATAQPQMSTTVRWDWPVIEAALKGRSGTAIDIFDGAELGALSPELAQRASLELVPSRDVPDPRRTMETRGMLIHSASALSLPDGRRAALVGGKLLNWNLEFINTINDLVYHGAGLPSGSRGTATLFLGDVRISTNVHLFQGRRAIGTLVSSAVRDAVLDAGQTWLGSAFVVDDWYISAYEPLIDSYGRRVGMLYVGFLEQPFTDKRHEILLGMAVAFLTAVVATVPLFLRWARAIFKPLERITGTIARVDGGDFGARTGRVDTKDEVGQVALHLDQLLDRLQERDTLVRHWNAELNRRVEERALKLQNAHRQLETRTKQLIMSEKLAAIGEITAGVAHEINNPIAVIQGNLEVIRESMGDEAEATKVEFGLIHEQMDRMSGLVAKLLQFAKPHEYASHFEQYAAADIVVDTLPLVQHLLKKSMVVVRREDHATRLVLMNRSELQQVLVNLMINAIYAMPSGGQLALRTFDVDEGDRPGVVIEVADTGAGMTPDVIRRIFDPFFTTKGREGTGLGLSISHMLVTRHGGSLSFESEPGQGTTFAVWLPEAN